MGSGPGCAGTPRSRHTPVSPGERVLPASLSPPEVSPKPAPPLECVPPKMAPETGHRWALFRPRRPRVPGDLPCSQRPLTAPGAGQKSVEGKGSLVGNEINLVTSVRP